MNTNPDRIAKAPPPDHMRCQSIVRSTGERCKLKRYKGSTRCHKHGGKNDEARTTHGRYRKIKQAPAPLLSEQIEEVKRIWQDPKSLRHEILYLRAIYLKRVREIEKGNSLLLTSPPEEVVRAKIEDLRRFVEIGTKLRAGEKLSQDETDFIDAHRLREELTERDAKTLCSILEYSTRIVERMVRIEDGLQVNITMPEMGDMVGQIKKALREAVEEYVDERTAKMIKDSLAARFKELSLRGRREGSA